VGTEHTRPTRATLMGIGTTTAIRAAEDPISRFKMEYVSLTRAAKRSACATPRRQATRMLLGDSSQAKRAVSAMMRPLFMS
jgi:hypothetical protein